MKEARALTLTYKTPWHDFLPSVLPLSGNYRKQALKGDILMILSLEARVANIIS